MSLCEDGQWSTYTCDEFCGALGFAGGPCSADFCECGDVLDPVCADGAAGYCACAEGTEYACTQEDFLGMYVGCFLGDLPEIECVADYVVGDSIDCASAFESCF